MPNVKKINIIATLLIIVGVIGVMFTYKTAFSNEDMVTAEKTINDTINELQIEIDNGSVEVYPTSGTEISLTLDAKNPEEILTTNVSDEKLSITVKEKRKKWFNFDFLISRPKLKVYVPEKEFTEFTVRSNNGRITAEDVQSEAIKFLTDNGRIDVTNVTGSTVEAETDNGKITLKDIVATYTTVSADNGKIVLDHVSGDIVGHASNGAISLKTDDLNKNIDLKTSNGKINIDTVNKPTNAIIDIQIGNGRARVFGQSNWDTVIGDGDHLIKLKTNNGSITIE